MDLVIKLSDTEYNQLIYGDDGLDYEILEQATVNGTPLPKGLQGVYDEGYKDGKHDGYCSSIIERGIEQSHYKDDYMV